MCQHRHCQSPISTGRKRGRIYKLMSHIPNLGPDRVPMGTHFLMASLQPLLHMPPTKHLQLSSHTSGCLTHPHSPCLELFTAVPKLYLIQTASLNSACVSLCKFPIPIFLSQLLLSCTLLLTTQ